MAKFSSTIGFSEYSNSLSTVTCMLRLFVNSFISLPTSIWLCSFIRSNSWFWSMSSVSFNAAAFTNDSLWMCSSINEDRLSNDFSFGSSSIKNTISFKPSVSFVNLNFAYLNGRFCSHLKYKALNLSLYPQGSLE